MNRKETQNNILLMRNEIIAIPIDKLIRKEELGELNFGTAEMLFKNTQELIINFIKIDLGIIPIEILELIPKICIKVKLNIQEIKEFTIATLDPVNERNELIKTMVNNYKDMFTLIAPYISYFNSTKVNNIEYTEQLLEFVRQCEIEKDNILKTANEIAEIEKAAKKAILSVGISEHSIHFKNEADENKQMADKWLKYTYRMAIATGVVAILALLSYLCWGSDLVLEKTIQIAITKVVVLSIMYYATVWCGKNYRSYMHNYVVNKHRQNGLSTFEAFVKGTSDEATKNAVLLRSTEAIFGNAHSGFNSNEAEGTGSPQILEIIKTVSNSKS